MSPKIGRIHKKNWKLMSHARLSVSGTTCNLRHLSKAILVTTRKVPKKKYDGKDISLTGIKEWR